MAFFPMGMYSGLSATKLDSHANNMAVARTEMTIIAHSGTFAILTPFSKDLPAMDMVEIGDPAMCFDDPILLVLYILVMKNVLLIPSMGHNLIPPFLIWEAGLILDKTPKHQTPFPSILTPTQLGISKQWNIFLLQYSVFDSERTGDL